MIEIALKNDARITAAISEDRVLPPGEEIGLTFDPAQAHLFAHEERGYTAY